VTVLAVSSTLGIRSDQELLARSFQECPLSAKKPNNTAADEKGANPVGSNGRVDALRARLVRWLMWVPEWASAHRRMAAGLAAGLLLLSVVVAWWLATGTQAEITVDERLQIALEAFDQEDDNRARYEAGVVNQSSGLSAEQVSTVAFLYGAMAAREAEKLLGRARTWRYLIASRYLEEAYARGFPDGYEGLGEYLFGKALFESGQLPASRPILERALTDYPQRRTEIHRLLASAYLRDPRDLLDKAKSHADAYLRDGRLTPDERHEGLLVQARIHFLGGDLREAADMLSSVPARSPLQSEVLLLRAQIAMRRAANQRLSEADSELLYRDAIKLLEQSQERDTLRNRMTPKAMYLIGICLSALGDTPAALAQWERVRKLHSDTSEGLAASLEAADLLLKSERLDEAIDVYREMLDQLAEQAGDDNPWINREEMRRRLLLAYDGFVERRRFEAALALVDEMHVLFSQERLTQIEAETHVAWAEDLLAGSSELRPEESRAAQQSAYEQYRLAGDAYHRLAQDRRVTRDYPDDLWHAAQNYVRGRAYSTAARLLEEYLEIELRERRPLALVAYGEALLALGRYEESLAALNECLENYARDAASFDARLFAAQAHLELSETEQAERLLRENLEGDLLTPASRQWAQSLFDLGHLYYLESRYDEALKRLDEYVARYPESELTQRARYLAGVSARRRATQLTEELDREKTETARLASLRVIRDYQTRALERFAQLQATLNELQSRRPLWPHEDALLRNCYLFRGATLADLERFEDAIDVYATTTNRYQHEPVALEAYIQIAYCYQRLHRPNEADGVLAQAQIVLESTPEEASFSEVTNFSREQWKEVLDEVRAHVRIQ